MIVKSYCSNYRDIDITISNLSLISDKYESGMCTFHIQLNHSTLIKTFESAEYSEVLSTGSYAESYINISENQIPDFSKEGISTSELKFTIFQMLRDFSKFAYFDCPKSPKNVILIEKIRNPDLVIAVFNSEGLLHDYVKTYKNLVDFLFQQSAKAHEDENRRIPVFEIKLFKKEYLDFFLRGTPDQLLQKLK